MKLIWFQSMSSTELAESFNGPRSGIDRYRSVVVRSRARAASSASRWRSFAKIHDRAAKRKGGAKALEASITKPKSAAALRRVGDDRWLSGMARAVFNADFVWRVVENKWPDFERAFQSFDPHAVAYLSDDDIEALLGDPGIIRHHKKILSTRENGAFVP